MTFGERLRQLREERGLTREGLASASGVPLGTIHGYEIGRRLPALAATLKLGKALGVDCTAFADCEDLAGEEPEPEKPAPKPKKGKKA
jgi:transcriptional regulator with XRE-family HTH domain